MLKIDLPRKDFAQKYICQCGKQPIAETGNFWYNGCSQSLPKKRAMQSETLRDGNCPLYLRERCRKKSGRRRGKPVLFWYEISQASEGGSAKPL